MAGFDIAVLPVEDDRFCIALVDATGRVMKAPDRGEDRRGYTETTLIETLRKRYGVPGEEARLMIARAARAPITGGV